MLQANVNSIAILANDVQHFSMLCYTSFDDILSHDE